MPGKGFEMHFKKGYLETSVRTDNKPGKGSKIHIFVLPLYQFQKMESPFSLGAH